MDILGRIIRWLVTRQDRRLDRLEAAEPDKRRRHAERMEALWEETEGVKARLAEEFE